MGLQGKLGNAEDMNRDYGFHLLPTLYKNRLIEYLQEKNKAPFVVRSFLKLPLLDSTQIHNRRLYYGPFILCRMVSCPCDYFKLLKGSGHFCGSNKLTTCIHRLGHQQTMQVNLWGRFKTLRLQNLLNGAPVSLFHFSPVILPFIRQFFRLFFATVVKRFLRSLKALTTLICMKVSFLEILG